MSKVFISGQDYNIANSERPIAHWQSLNLSDPSQLILKRSFDVIFSLFLLIFICSWLFPCIALMIKLTSEGPVVFKQLRHGRNNVPFYCFKFRTRRINGEADTNQAKRNDPRVTKIGLLLKITRLDELPRIFNVIMGEMSIVGPSPNSVINNYKFSEGIDDFMCRHAVKPGIIGLAQYKGYRGGAKGFLDLYSRCRLDLFYIKHWSLWLDLKLVGWSVVSLFTLNKTPDNRFKPAILRTEAKKINSLDENT